MSAYNSDKKEKEEEPYSIMCPANGCPMLSSVYVEGGPWTCRYHSKKPHIIWPKITALLIENMRWFKIIGAADALDIDQYGSIQSKNAWKLDELIRPVPGELHPQWVHRVKDTVFKAVQNNIDKIAKAEASELEGMPESTTIHDLTSGMLMSKKVKPE